MPGAKPSADSPAAAGGVRRRARALGALSSSLPPSLPLSPSLSLHALLAALLLAYLPKLALIKRSGVFRRRACTQTAPSNGPLRCSRAASHTPRRARGRPWLRPPLRTPGFFFWRFFFSRLVLVSSTHSRLFLVYFVDFLQLTNSRVVPFLAVTEPHMFAPPPQNPMSNPHPSPPTHSTPHTQICGFVFMIPTSLLSIAAGAAHGLRR